MQNYSALTARYLKQHRGRTILTLIGIIVAIAMFTCIGSIYYSGINSEIDRVKSQKGDYEIRFYEMDKVKVSVLENNAEIKNGGVQLKEGTLSIKNDLLTESLKELNIKSYDAKAFKEIFMVNIVEGRLPENDTEIIVDKKFYAILKDKKIGDVLSGEFSSAKETVQKQYKVVGSYESSEITNWAISYLDIKTSADTREYEYFANIKQNENKVDVAMKIAKSNGIKLDPNSSLLYLLGEGPDKRKNNDLDIIFGIIAGFVVLCTIVVIYNAFNISVMERIKHFGILRSIGATKSQIRRLVLKEAAIMSLISIPIGILTGFAGIMITFNLFMEGFLGAFKIGFYPQVIIAAAALGLFTVFASAFFPARTASKVSPIDAIRGTMVVKGDKVKRRSGGFWAKLVFKFEGQVAYKNIKRSKKRFYITCISLMVSLIMFVFFSNFIDILFESNKIISSTIKIEGTFSTQHLNDSPYLNENIIKGIEGLDGIKEIYKVNYGSIPYIIDKRMLSDKFVGSIKKLKTTQEYKDKYIVDRIQMLGYDENAFKLINTENKLKLNYESYNKNNGIIIFNKAGGMDQEDNRFYDSFSKYKVGDEITLPILDSKYMENPDAEQLKKIIDLGKTMTFKVVAVVDYEALSGSVIYNSYGMIMSSENYTKLTGVNGLGIIAINFNSPEYSNKHFEKLNILADENKAIYDDINVMKKQSDQLQNQMMILIYGFISLIVLISTVNIINTVTINLLVKKREYATFKAIGMTKGQFKKLVLLEGALFGIIASIVGLPLSYLLTYFGIIKNNPLGSIGYTTAIWPYLYGGAGIIAITLLAAMIPLRKLNDMNIVEALRIEE